MKRLNKRLRVLASWSRSFLKSIDGLLRPIALTGVLVAAICMAFAPSQARAVTVFAASSTQHVISEILLRCPTVVGRSCKGVFAASSTLARQIENAAPADIFVSANIRWMDHLQSKETVLAASRRVIARNRLVVVTPQSEVNLPTSLAAGLIWLSQDRIAIGDPSHVPAGIYAKQSLSSLNAWQQLSNRMLRLPNARAALNVVITGEARAGIVYASDALVSDRVKIAFKLPEDTHEPIVYPAAIVTERETADAHAVLELLSSPFARQLFMANGFIEGDR